MVQQTRGIVLQRFKYSDSTVIAKIFTEKFGLISCIFFGTEGKKGQFQVTVLQPMYIIEFMIYYKEAGNFQKVKEIGLSFPLVSISMNIVKNTICSFMAEFLLKTLKENEADHDLFQFLKQAIEKLNQSETNFADFHLLFLFKLTKYLGIMPLNNYSESNAIFDMKLGKFITGNPSHSHFMNIHQSELFSKFFDMKTGSPPDFIIPTRDRKEMLSSLIDYYNIHLDRPGELNSLKVLKEVFS
jgi:DNA repair protein RecO (recombination protein O)